LIGPYRSLFSLPYIVDLGKPPPINQTSWASHPLRLLQEKPYLKKLSPQALSPGVPEEKTFRKF